MSPITVNASQFKARVGDYLDQSQKNIIFVTKYNKKKSVLMNTDYYQILKEQVVKAYAQEMLDKTKKNDLDEDEILRLTLEAEQWAKK